MKFREKSSLNLKGIVLGNSPVFTLILWFLMNHETMLKHQISKTSLSSWVTQAEIPYAGSPISFLTWF